MKKVIALIIVSILILISLIAFYTSDKSSNYYSHGDVLVTVKKMDICDTGSIVFEITNNSDIEISFANSQSAMTHFGQLRFGEDSLIKLPFIPEAPVSAEFMTETVQSGGSITFRRTSIYSSNGRNTLNPPPGVYYAILNFRKNYTEQNIKSELFKIEKCN